MNPSRIGKLAWDFRRPLVLGVLNVTPDSFSDGGTFADPDRAVERVRVMVAEGADVVDIGGESTRPGGREVPTGEEIDRVAPVVRRIVREVGVPVSIDTRKAAVCEAALDAGAAMVNDVSMLRFDPALAGLVARARVPIVLMHSRGTPADMREHARYDDVVNEVVRELGVAVGRAVESGIERDAIWIDPGIGFAKTAAHSLAVLGRLEALHALGRPIVVGASRKSFIGEVTGATVGDRAGGTAAAIALAVWQGAHAIRVHDVGWMRQAALIADAIAHAAADAVRVARDGVGAGGAP